LTGKLKPASAFMTGKLNISGSMQKAMKLEKLMTSLKSKLWIQKIQISCNIFLCIIIY